MVQVMEFLSYLNMVFITFLLVELLLSLIFTEDWKFRHKKAKGHPQLRPYSKSWKITWTFLILIFVILPIITTALWFFLPALLVKLGWNQLFILFAVSPMVYLWAKLRIIKKKSFDWWDSIPISITIISIILFFYFLLK